MMITKIHLTKLTNNDVAKSLAALRKAYGIAITALVVGVFGLILLGGFVFQNVNIILCAVSILLGFITFAFATAYIIITYFSGIKLKYLNDIISEVREAQILYLHDNCFNGLHQQQKLTLCKKLTQSVNLDSYELIAEVALVKKSLHLSTNRVIELMRPENFGLASKITKNQLIVSESDTLLIPTDLKEQQLREPIFPQNPKLISAHNDRMLSSNFDKEKLICGILFWAGIVLFILGLTAFIIILVAVDDAYLAVLAFVLACAIVPLSIVSDNRHKRLMFFTHIVNTISIKNVTGIYNECFNGLTYFQRVSIVETLINNGHINNRKVAVTPLITAIVKINKDYTMQEILSELGNNAPQADIYQVEIKEARTNCLYCGRGLECDMNYCAFCGQKNPKNERVLSLKLAKTKIKD